MDDQMIYFFVPTLWRSEASLDTPDDHGQDVATIDSGGDDTRAFLIIKKDDGDHVDDVDDVDDGDDGDDVYDVYDGDDVYDVRDDVYHADDKWPRRLICCANLKGPEGRQVVAESKQFCTRNVTYVPAPKRLTGTKTV